MTGQENRTALLPFAADSKMSGDMQQLK